MKMKKTITLKELSTLASSGDWNKDTTFALALDGPTCGHAILASSANWITVTYTETFFFGSGLLEVSRDPQPWSIQGAIVVDEDGAEVSTEEWADCLTEAFRSVDYTPILDGTLS